MRKLILAFLLLALPLLVGSTVIKKGPRDSGRALTFMFPMRESDTTGGILPLMMSPCLGNPNTTAANFTFGQSCPVPVGFEYEIYRVTYTVIDNALSDECRFGISVEQENTMVLEGWTATDMGPGLPVTCSRRDGEGTDIDTINDTCIQDEGPTVVPGGGVWYVAIHNADGGALACDEFQSVGVLVEGTLTYVGF